MVRTVEKSGLFFVLLSFFWLGLSLPASSLRRTDSAVAAAIWVLRGSYSALGTRPWLHGRSI